MTERPLTEKELESIKANLEKLRLWGIEHQRITAIFVNALAELKVVIDRIKAEKKEGD